MNYKHIRVLILIFAAAIFIFDGLVPARALARPIIVRTSIDRTSPNDPPPTSPPPASPPPATPPPAVFGKTISLNYLGVLQLATHDLFDFDRPTGVNKENGKLDLSTLLDHGDDLIAIGGEFRNQQNIIIASVASQLGARYLELINSGVSESSARRSVMHTYHFLVRRAYRDAFSESIIQPQSGSVTVTENLALRTAHDYLPGKLFIDGTFFNIADPALQGRLLTAGELRARSSALDGQFDPELRDLLITIPPDMTMHIDLLERDSSFAQEFGADHTFEFFLAELEDGSYDRDDLVTSYIRTLFAKGMNL